MDKNRPLSWSAISSFEYDKEEWYKKYVLHEKQLETEEMRFGKKVGDRIATDPTYLPFVPRLDTFEHKFQVMFGKLPLIGYADSFCMKTNKKLYEFKTGVKKWDQKRVNDHGQIDMYLLMHYITKKVRPEDVEVQLVWLPTKRSETGDFKVTIAFVEPIEKNMKVFKTKRTLAQILKFGARINKVYNEMEEFTRSKLISHDIK